MSHDIIDNSSGIVKNLPIPSPVRACLGRREDLTGQVFGRLTALSQVSQTGKSVWLCLCTCGGKKHILACNLKSGAIESCGCLQKENRTTHGLSKNPLYNTWANMIKRCTEPNSRSFADYGGRGITVDPRWKNFANFLEDMEPTHKSGLTLDRIDNDGNYEKLNCRWTSHKEQTWNRRSNRVVSYQNQDKSLAEWCEILKLTYSLVQQRIKKGWTPEQAFELPYGSRNPNKQ